MNPQTCKHNTRAGKRFRELSSENDSEAGAALGQDINGKNADRVRKYRLIHYTHAVSSSPAKHYFEST
jgi:hypothetical protein